MPTNDLDAILFDLDGVIIDSEPLHEKAFRQTSLHLGRDLTPEEVAFCGLYRLTVHKDD